MKKIMFISLVISSIILSACFGPLPALSVEGVQPLDNGVQLTIPQVQRQPVALQPSVILEAVDQTQPVESDHEHHSDVDLTHLEVGDGRYSTSPEPGYVYTCMTSFNGGGAQGTGNWMNGDGTWDATKKAVVDGSVTWPGSFTISVQGDQRILAGNDLP